MTALAAPARASSANPWPIRAAPSRAVRGSPTLALSTLTAAMWGGLAVQKLALPGNVELTLPVIAAAVAFLVVAGRVRLSLPRLFAFALLAAAIALSQVLAADERDASLPAIAVALALYALFLFVVPLEAGQRMLLLRRFQAMALVVAGLVALQWTFQLAGRPMPSLETVVPEPMLYQSYNYIQPIAWRSVYMKPNGLVMLEASHASQLLAMATVIEVCLFRRWWRVAALVVAQLATFGGTGFVLLLVSLPLFPFHLRGRAATALAALALVVAVGARFTPVWHNFAARSGEVGGEDVSSGNGRFVEPYVFMADRLAADGRTLVSGIGPGNGKYDRDRTAKLVMNPLVKAVVEYGLPTGVVWMVFIHGCVLRGAMPFVVVYMTLVQYDFLNGSLLVPLNLLYCWVLAAAHPRRIAA